MIVWLWGNDLHSYSPVGYYASRAAFRAFLLGGYLVLDGKTKGRTPEPASFERGAAKMTGLGRLFVFIFLVKEIRANNDTPIFFWYGGVRDGWSFKGWADVESWICV